MDLEIGKGIGSKAYKPVNNMFIKTDIEFDRYFHLSGDEPESSPVEVAQSQKCDCIDASSQFVTKEFLISKLREKASFEEMIKIK